MTLLTDISVRYSSDGMKVFALVPMKSSDASVAAVIADLNQYGIVHGIDSKAIEKIFTDELFDQYILVARGTPPKPGVPGRIELLVDTSRVGRPEERENGRVDHKLLGYIINVRSGDLLARRIPPQFGIEGTTVFGKKVKATEAEDVELKGGDGTKLSPEDANLLIAECDGSFVLHENGLIEVRQRREISGDIDYSTGNISFIGDLLIRGNVRAGFKVEVTGSLKISGRVEDAFLKCGGDLVISSGVVGSGKGVIECGGDMKVRHLENIRVITKGDLMVSEDVIHASVNSKGKVKAGSVVGGTVCSFSGIDIQRAGSGGEVRTVLDVGARYTWLKQKTVLNEKLEREKELLESCKHELFCFVRDEMDQNGVISDEKQNDLEQFLQKAVESNGKCKSIIEKLDEVEAALNEKSNPVINARELYPNVLVRMGSVERLVKEVVRNAVLRPTEFK
ncbi:MAG: DUF342 domain-containing protein [Chitinispirillaceae bacterium]